MWNKFLKFIRDLVCEHRSTSTIHYSGGHTVTTCSDCKKHVPTPPSAVERMNGTMNIYYRKH